MKKLAERGARIVLVLTGGSPIALGELEDLVEAIVFVWYPGQEGGRAVAEVLFGDVAPSGKLPLTFPRSLEQLPPYEDYAMAGRTYRYMTAEPLYPFGFGLSYTRFGYSELELAQERIAAGDGAADQLHRGQPWQRRGRGGGADLPDRPGILGARAAAQAGRLPACAAEARRAAHAGIYDHARDAGAGR